jgi:group I intron endonuclease
MKKIYIYKITNTKNNKIYIGQSTNPQRRFKQHLNENRFIIDDVDKYGKDAFTLQILDECSDINCGEVEAYYINKYDCVNNGYNVLKCSGTNSANVRRVKQWNTGLTKETDERVMKISKALKGKYVGEKSPSYGLKRSEETRKKLSAIRRTETGEKNHFYGHHHSEAAKAHFSETKKGRKCLIKDNICKFVKPEDIQTFLDNGYRYAKRCEIIKNKKHSGE